MEGKHIKRLLIKKNVDMNSIKYFENDVKYDIKEMPRITVDKDLFKKRVIDRYGKENGMYLFRMISKDTNDVCAIDIMKIVKNE